MKLFLDMSPVDRADLLGIAAAAVPHDEDRLVAQSCACAAPHRLNEHEVRRTVCAWLYHAQTFDGEICIT